jgi:hypothetical protein
MEALDPLVVTRIIGGVCACHSNLVLQISVRDGRIRSTALHRFCRPKELEALLANRLVPLDKNPGLRPVEIGEVPRRIIGKAILHVLRNDIQQCAGALQLCAGQEAGCEAAIHAMTRMFESEGTDGLLLVDADNAFNRLNRSVALWNVQFICSVFSVVLINCYRSPARLFVTGGMELASHEGTTQGDPLAMAMYAVGIRHLSTLSKASPQRRFGSRMMRKGLVTSKISVFGGTNFYSLVPSLDTSPKLPKRILLSNPTV